MKEENISIDNDWICMLKDTGDRCWRTAIKYILTDRSAEIGKVNEMKTDRTDEELFNSLEEIIAPT
ncbi:hypothetical protein [uncultured Methanobrevibacter sp.]|uniref:hypothetical protein n=1 Tax=uncultured Methanobrevibacter sp. TaxID=253161 RepID=UPI00320AEAEC